MSKLKIVFVCTGNICRSPLAEGVFLARIAKLGIASQFEVDSCGTSSYHVGSLPDHRAIAAAHKHSIQLNCRARQIVSSDLEYYDFLLVMDHLNYEAILDDVVDESIRNKVFLLRSFDPSTKVEYDVPDPYYGTIADFEEVFKMCERSIDGFIDYLYNLNIISPPTSD
ncbi:MAG: low molecular weight phosphotyrosine protein phosphatase [Burkholderiales bacterium]|nr:low molecular weight phosphotyrosine protein phosphatase [Burkholderiales bacterium]